MSSVVRATSRLGAGAIRCLKRTLPMTSRSRLMTRSLHSTSVQLSQDMPSIVDMRQGEKTPSVFSQQEFDARLQKLRGHMRTQNIDAVVFTSYQNINYYTGFMYCYFGRDYGVVITQKQRVLVTAAVDAGQPWRRSITDANTIYTDWQTDNYYRGVRKILGDDFKGTIGLEHDHVTLENIAKWESAFPGCPKVDVGKSVQHMRMVKSPEEIGVIKHGARIADLGGAAVVEALREGVPEHVVALASTQAMVMEIAKTFPDVDILDTWTWFQSGINTDGAHNPVTTRKVQKGDILSLNCFPMIGGYYTALERTLFLDHASDAHLDYWQKNVAVHERGLQLMKPGVTCKDIAIELNELCRELGVLQYRSFGYGHSFGSLCHYYGREGDLELREDIETVLRPGMVVSMEPMVMIPEGQPGAGGYREHDILVITENGADNITKFPYGPEKNIIKV